MLIFKPLNLTITQQENIRGVADVFGNTPTRRFSRYSHQTAVNVTAPVLVSDSE
jgi:hypothetical protein